MKKGLKNWFGATEKLAKLFVETYYEGTEYWWVGQQIGGALTVDGYFWSMDTIVTALGKEVSEEDLFDWYDKTTEEGLAMNLEHYLKSKLKLSK